MLDLRHILIGALFVLGQVEACAGKNNALVAVDWQQRLRSYEQAMTDLYRDSVSRRVVTYHELLLAVYGTETRDQIAAVRAWRSCSKFRPMLSVDREAGAAVVVDPVAAERKGLHAYLDRSAGVIAVNPPGSRYAYDPLRQAVALAHEMTHQAQDGLGRYPAWLQAWHQEIRQKHPRHRGTYLLTPEEMEVRLAEMRRMIWVLGAELRPESATVRRWFALLGVQGVRSESDRTLRCPEVPSDLAAELRRAFPDCCELAEILQVKVAGLAEERRQSLITFWCDQISGVL